MNALYALLLATPVFGFQLSAPALDFGLPSELDVAVPADAVAPQPSVPGSGTVEPALVEPGLNEPSVIEPATAPQVAAVPTASDTASAAAEAQEAAYADALHARNRLAKVHRILGISTWVAMGATLTLGAIQYWNLYGFGGTYSDNPCVDGDAIGGYEACVGRPLPHLISSLVTTGLYVSTLTLALLMPDPDDAATGDSEFARTLRTHKILRWVHLVGMVAQVALGVVTANVFDRANPDDFATAQALATVHLGLGLVTFGALTWAGALMAF